MSIRSIWLTKRESVRPIRRGWSKWHVGLTQKQKRKPSQDRISRSLQHLKDLPVSSVVFLCFLTVLAFGAIMASVFIVHDLLGLVSVLLKWQLVLGSLFSGQGTLPITKLYSYSCVIVQMFKRVSY